MSGIAVSDQRRIRPGQSRRQPGREQSRYDQALGTAKNQKATVRFTMAQEAEWLDQDCELDCQILTIDKFDIEVLPQGWGVDSSIWLKKSAIMATRIFR